MDIIFKGGTIVSSKESKKADIRISGEKIVEISDNIKADNGCVIDVTDRVLFPGFIDTHTHFDLDTGNFRTADNFETGTKAAIVGGTTTVLDFATQNRGETLQEGLDNWHNMADGNSSCDYGFHMAISEWNENIRNEIPIMTREGVTSYKMYMAYDNLRVNDAEMFEILKAVSKENGIAGVHCENGDLVNEGIKEQKLKSNFSPAAHPLSRPDYVEEEAVNRYLTIAKMAGVPVNIVHLSTKKGLEIVRRFRKTGQKIYVETCPQYLLMDDSRYLEEGFNGAKYVMSPPLRKKEDCEALWEALKNNEIDTIGTDHCSFNFKGQKEFGKEDFSKIPNGGPGVEHRGVLIYSEGVRNDRINKEQMCSLLAENPAKLFGLYPQKGVIAVGSDADIVIWNENDEKIISADEQVQNVDYTPYEGMKVTGLPEAVYLRGKKIAQNGKVFNEKQGKYIERKESIYF